MATDWKMRTVSLSELRRDAEVIGEWDWGILGFLRNIGVVPWDVRISLPESVRLNVNPDAIPVGYLASMAYEWDTWGPSQPSDFLDALECELVPQRRDFIARVLTALGRSE